MGLRKDKGIYVFGGKKGKKGSDLVKIMLKMNSNLR